MSLGNHRKVDLQKNPTFLADIHFEVAMGHEMYDRTFEIKKLMFSTCISVSQFRRTLTKAWMSVPICDFLIFLRTRSVCIYILLPFQTVIAPAKIRLPERNLESYPPFVLSFNEGTLILLFNSGPLE